MHLPRDQRVSDLLHRIADLVQEADSFLTPKTRAPSFAGIFTNQNKAPFSELFARRMREKLSPPARDVLRARRERKARSRYNALKLVKAGPAGAGPRKILGTRFRNR